MSFADMSEIKKIQYTEYWIYGNNLLIYLSKL